MKRFLPGIVLVVAAALAAYLIAGLLVDQSGDVDNESRLKPSRTGKAASKSVSKSSSQSLPADKSADKKKWIPNPDKEDPGPAPYEPSERIMKMKPDQIADLADERMGDFLACTNAIDECFDETLDEMDSDDELLNRDSANAEKLKNYFKVGVHNAIGYFEFIARHRKRLDDGMIDEQEFYYRLRRRSWLFDATLPRLLENSYDTMLSEPDPGITRTNKNDIFKFLKLSD